MSDPLFAIDGRAILVAGGAGGLGAPMAAALAESRSYLEHETGAEPAILDELFRG